MEDLLNNSVIKENCTNHITKEKTKNFDTSTTSSLKKEKKTVKTVDYQSDFNIIERSKDVSKPLKIQKKNAKKLVIFDESANEETEEENLKRKVRKEFVIEKKDDPVLKFAQKVKEGDLKRKVRKENHILPFQDPLLSRLTELYPPQENLKRKTRTHARIINLTQDIQNIKDLYK
eukprot:gene3183-5499_t